MWLANDESGIKIDGEKENERLTIYQRARSLIYKF